MDKVAGNEKRYELKGLQICGIAFAIIALAGFAVQIVRVFADNYLVALGYLGVLLLGWVLMFLGARRIARYAMDFRMVGRLTMPAIAGVVLASCFGVINVKSEMGRLAFMTFGVQFLMYIPFLVLMMAYWYSLRGASGLCVEFRKLKQARSCKNIRWPGLLIIIVATFAVQTAPVFPELIKYIVTASAALISLSVQMVMIHHLLAVYDMADGKKPVERLEDVMPDMRKNKPDNDRQGIIHDEEKASDLKEDEPSAKSTEIDLENNEEPSAETRKEKSENLSAETRKEKSENLSAETRDEKTEELNAVEELKTSDSVPTDIEDGIEDVVEREIVEEDWLRKEFDEIALVGKDEATFEDFKDTVTYHPPTTS